MCLSEHIYIFGHFSHFFLDGKSIVLFTSVAANVKDRRRRKVAITRLTGANSSLIVLPADDCERLGSHVHAGLL